MPESVEYDHDIDLVDDSRIINLPSGVANGQPLRFQQLGCSPNITQAQAEAITIAETAIPGCIYYDITNDSMLRGNALGQLVSLTSGQIIQPSTFIDFRTADLSLLNFVTSGTVSTQTATEIDTTYYNIQRDATLGLRIRRKSFFATNRVFKFFEYDGESLSSTIAEEKTFEIIYRALGSGNAYNLGIVNKNNEVNSNYNANNQCVNVFDTTNGGAGTTSLQRIQYASSNTDIVDVVYSAGDILKLEITGMGRIGKIQNVYKLLSGTGTIEDIFAPVNHDQLLGSFTSEHNSAADAAQPEGCPGFFIIVLGNGNTNVQNIEILGIRIY